MYKTDYFGIHENQYKYLRENNRKGWGEEDEKQKIFEKVLNILKKYRIPERSKILELGCGDAELSLKLTEEKFNSYGIDISPTAIKWANKKANKREFSGNFIVGNVINLPYPENYFDIIIDSLCLHCIIGDDREKLLKRIKKVLKENGLFLGFTMCGEPAKDIKKDFNYKTRNLVRNGIAGRYIGEWENIIGEIERIGFKKLDHEIERSKNDEDNDTLIFVFKNI